MRIQNDNFKQYLFKAIGFDPIGTAKAKKECLNKLKLLLEHPEAFCEKCLSPVEPDKEGVWCAKCKTYTYN